MTISHKANNINNHAPFVIDLAQHPDMFKGIDGAVFDVSSRFISPEAHALDYLSVYFIYLDKLQIDTVFGNTAYPSKLYGGRPYRLENSLSNQHIEQLKTANIGLSLTLTNHFFDDKTYEQNLEFLERHHSENNTIVCTNNDLARRIRADFPQYKLKASLIKHLNTQERVERALSLYDYVVIPMDKNDDIQFLENLPEKERIYLFGNANCAYNCPSRSCYVGISQDNQQRPKTSKCSIPVKPRDALGHIFFDVKAFASMGYHRFKMVPNSHTNANAALNALTQLRQKGAKNTPLRRIAPKPDAVIHSYPKCGRTWLRFILAGYLNKLHDLGLPINLQSIFTLLPNAGADPLKGVNSYQFSHKTTLPLIGFSHKSPSLKPGSEKRTILLIRSILDVVVSDYFHQSRLLSNYSGSLTEFIHDDKGGLARYLHYLNRCAECVSDHTLILTYESLKQDTYAEVCRLLDYLNIELKPELLTVAIEEASFDNMSKAESASGIAGHNNNTFADPEARRTRKGVVNGYKQYLSEEDIDYCRKQVALALTPATLNWLRKVGIDELVR